MHRTQIYLPDELHDRLKARSRTNGTSVSELIRQAIEKDLQQRSVPSDVRQFFDQMTPLESFADIEPEEYVRSLRNTSRILRDE
jgi:Arc/MetJ-type ribon-helix-helix transcriptional regulator